MMGDNEYGLLDIQSRLLELLIDFHNICSNSNIQYSVFSGTMLGAVREKGFIPWDDDIDVMMNMDNYNRLQSVLCFQEKYYLDTEDAWVPRFRCKDIENGPFIDVFILAGAPQGLLRIINIFKLMSLQGMLKKYTTHKKVSLLYKVLLFVTRIMGKVFPRKRLIAKYWDIGYGKSYNSEYYYMPNVGFGGLKYLLNRKKIDEGYSVIDFEGIKVNIYKEYDYILRVLYGESYMTPVNEENRIQYHSDQIDISDKG